MPSTYQNLWGGPQTFNEITVSFPYTGSNEVFSYRANGTLGMSMFYQPTGNSIDVDVLLPQLNKEQALAKAHEEMAATLQLGLKPLKHGRPTWQTLTEEQAVIKRKELLELYS